MRIRHLLATAAADVATATLAQSYPAKGVKWVATGTTTSVAWSRVLAR